jgi:circadian clock protein KaiC
LEALFAALTDGRLLRSELQRLFRWLKDQGVTSVVTAERGEGTLTRYGLEEYVSDCVILLDHRVLEQVSTRRLRIVKYRGSRHSADEIPFMIDEYGFRVLPLTSLRLEHDAPLGDGGVRQPRGRGEVRGGAARTGLPPRARRLRRGLRLVLLPQAPAVRRRQD